MTSPAVQNTVSNVVLRDCVYDSTGSNVSICLKRVSPPVDLIRPHSTEGWLPRVVASAVIPRPPSALPPPPSNTVTLQSTVSELIGSGRTGLVCGLKQISSSDPAIMFPELVVKIARPYRCADLFREAWFYEEMECLQGASIPRCYGYFEADLPEGCQVRLPKKQTCEEQSWNTISRSGVAELDEEPHPMVVHLRSVRNRLCILILERLGDRLPIGEPISAEVRADILDLFKEISSLGISNSADVRYANVLRAPTSPPGLPSLVSPFTLRKHDWRIIDFEMAEKSGLTLKWLISEHEETMRIILNCLERGFVYDGPSE